MKKIQLENLILYLRGKYKDSKTFYNTINKAQVVVDKPFGYERIDKLVADIEPRLTNSYLTDIYQAVEGRKPDKIIQAFKQLGINFK